jgi:glycerol-3-phosphate dehydrogenase
VNRDLARLASTEFDLLVIGGGIYGLATAYDAAQRGLTVALLERGDFGSATSFNHLKTIHGGLRYLQTGNLERMRESIRERRAFARIAPRFVAPLAFVMPTTRGPARHSWTMKTAFAIDALIGWDRNEGLPPSHCLPRGRSISPEECRALFSSQWTPASRRGVMWHDYEAVHGDRLTLAFALAAAGQGAALANYVEAGPLISDATLRGIRAKDLLQGTGFDVRARVVVNAAGPWASALLAQAGIAHRWPLMKAMNLVTSRPASKAALVGRTKSGRALILLPWQGRTLVGTSESVQEHQPDDQQARHVEVSVFVAEVNETFPGFNLAGDEVTLVHRGIVPAIRRGGRLALLAESKVLDHAADGIANLVSIVGVKYTTARLVAERAVDLVLRKLGRSPGVCRTADTMLPTAGTEAAQGEDRIARAVEAEMAQTLADVIVRRGGDGAAGYPGDAIVNHCGVAMQRQCGWSAARVSAEIASLKRFYEIL